jgi:uncharacterized protein
MDSVRVNGVQAERFERKTSIAGEPYFALNAANGEAIGLSEMYASAAAMESGIRSVMENAASTTVKDLT